MNIVDQGTPFTERISVNGTAATGSLVLTITDVRLEDELEFVCHINSLSDGKGEGRTQLRVFGETQAVGNDRKMAESAADMDLDFTYIRVT